MERLRGIPERLRAAWNGRLRPFRVHLVLALGAVVLLAGASLSSCNGIEMTSAVARARSTPPAAPLPAPTPGDVATPSETPDDDPTPDEDEDDSSSYDDSPDDSASYDDSSSDSEESCRTSTYVPSMTWVTFEDDSGTQVRVKHSYSWARTVEYEIDGGSTEEIDVEQTLIDGGTPAFEGGDFTFELRTKLGLETWDGSVRSARNTKVVMTVCGSWEQTGGNDIGL